MTNKETTASSQTHDLVAALRGWAQVLTHGVLRNTIAYCRKQGLTMPQVGALYHLLHARHCMVSTLGDGLGVTSAAMSQMLERLVQQGYVERLEDPEDRRAKKVSLTPKGAAMLRGSLEAGFEWMRELAASIQPAQREATTHALQQLTALAADLMRPGGPALMQ